MSDSNGKLRVGVAGMGRGKGFIKRFGMLDTCEVVATCDSKTDYAEFLDNDLDIVAVVSPGPVHAEQSVKAMEAGAHVLCETPCVYSVDEARAVIDATRRTGKTFMLAEDYIWLGWCRSVKARADEGCFGDILYAEGDYSHDLRDYMLTTDDGYVPYTDRAAHPEARKTWRATDLPPIYYVSHTLGPLLTFMDDRVISAIGLSTGVRTAPDLGTIDLETGIFETAKGAIIRLTVAFALAHPMGFLYTIAGTRGSFKRMAAGGSHNVWYSETVEPKMTDWQPVPEEWEADPYPEGIDHLTAMIGDFVDSVAAGRPPPIDVYRSMEFVLPGILAHESAMKNGEKISVPDLRGE